MVVLSWVSSKDARVSSSVLMLFASATASA